jgi:hypothetical protein
VFGHTLFVPAFGKETTVVTKPCWLDEKDIGENGGRNFHKLTFFTDTVVTGEVADKRLHFFYWDHIWPIAWGIVGVFMCFNKQSRHSHSHSGARKYWGELTLAS